MHRRTPLALVALLALASPALQADIIRDSAGQHRAELDRMELQAFPADAWSKLSNWTGGEAVSASTTGGKPVLIVTWASWNQPSLRALGTVQRMTDRFGKDGLIVVGAHHQQGWDEAAQTLKDRGGSFPIAHDSALEFRKALNARHEPSFYLIDRAGHLRYAAVTAASVEEACTELMAETAEQAADVPSIRRKRAEEDAAKGRRTVEIRPEMNLAGLPAVPPGFNMPAEAAFKHVGWPKVDETLGKDYGLIDQNGKKVEPKLNFTPHGFHPARPELQGRAIVIYLWNPDMLESYSTTMPQMDQLQQKYSRDLAVIGALVPVRTLDAQRNQGQEDQEPADKLMKRYQAFASSRAFKHTLAADLAGSAMASLGGSQGGSTKFPIPGAMIVSTDGVIRWVGATNGRGFEYAVDTILASDPGIRARRAADRAFIENAKR
jgi:hypothetical protein